MANDDKLNKQTTALDPRKPEPGRLKGLKIKKPDTTPQGIQSNKDGDSNERLQGLALSIRDYIGGYINLADSKAALLIGVFSGVLSYSFIKNEKLLVTSILVWRSFNYFLGFGWLLLGVAIFCALRVVWPKIASSAKNGLVSWVDISNYQNSEKYIRDLMTTTTEHLAGMVCALNFDLAQICKAKYAWLSRSFLLGLLGTLICVLCLAFS